MMIENVRKILSILVVFILLIFPLLGCQQGNGEPKENDSISKDEGLNQNESHKSQDKTYDEEDKGQGQYEKLDIKPSVSLRENYDYIGIDEPSVDFEIKDLKGDVVKLSDYKGQIVFLNFWATWCPPCRHEMPYMESIYQQYGDRGVAMLAVSSTEHELQWRGSDSKKAERQVREFIDKEGYTFPVLLDPDNEIVEEYRNIYPIAGIPITYMLDRKGIIRYVKPGAFQDEEQIKAFIAMLDQ